jgi:hypothetical protein
MDSKDLSNDECRSARSGVKSLTSSQTYELTLHGVLHQNTALEERQMTADDTPLHQSIDPYHFPHEEPASVVGRGLKLELVPYMGGICGQASVHRPDRL